MSFLNAEWRKLAIANYEIDPEILKPFVPNKTELDFWEDTCYVSLVGFMFLNTKLMGMSIPFHRNFEELNLRFYVRFKDCGDWKRGVVFIKEIVPKPALTFVANNVYKEHYQTMKMDHKWAVENGQLKVKYGWGRRESQNEFSIVANSQPQSIEEGSEAEFITEHYWGYTKASDKKSFEYEVTHPKWQCYDVLKHQIDVDFGGLYGKQFEHLNSHDPKSVMLAEGSEITVENKRRL
ncbi:MAG: DUF2071 domain-containing protein [Cyclobacteriaceae bacterium]